MLLVLSTIDSHAYTIQVSSSEAILKAQKYFYNIFLHIFSMQNNILNAEVTFQCE